MKKKLTAILLLIAFFALWQNQITIVANEHENSLYEFINSKKELTAELEYPSIKLSANISGKKILPARTQVIIKNDEELNTKQIISGSTIAFSVVQDVKDNMGNILIKAGTPVSANIKFEEQGMIGKSGKITVSDFHTKTVDGSYVPLTSSISAEPNDKMVLSIVLSVFICPLFLLLKGNHAIIPANTVKNVYTFSDVYVKTGTCI